MRLLRSLGAVLLLQLPALLAHSPAQGQQDARVLPRGVARLHLGGSFSLFDSRFGMPSSEGTSEREPLSIFLPTLLQSSSFPPLQTLQTDLNQLFEGTDTLGTSGYRADPENLGLTARDLRTSADVRTVPFGLEVGVLPRVSIGVRSALVRTRLELRSLGISGGSVGVNPDPAYNRALIAAVDSVVAANLSALGGSTLLPTRDSELGQELQARVRAATGGRELRLPVAPVDAVGVAGFDRTSFPSTGRFSEEESQWRLGDSEVSARVQLFNTAPGFPYPRDAGVLGVRAAVEAGLRVPTGQVADSGYLVLPIPQQGLGGPFVFVAGDIFAAPRLWASAAVRWESLSDVEFNHVTGSGGLTFPPAVATSRVRWNPGTLLAVDLLPRFRLAEELTLFGVYRNLRWHGESYTVLEGSPPIGEEEITRTAQQWGLGAEFSTLPAYFVGRRTLPFEASIVFRETFAGSAGAEALRTLEIRGSIYQPLWGRRPGSE